jgi:hypothetical protein
LADNAGCRECDHGDDKRGRRLWEGYVEEEWNNAVVEHGGVWEEGEGAEGSGDSVGVGSKFPLI